MNQFFFSFGIQCLFTLVSLKLCLQVLGLHLRQNPQEIGNWIRLLRKLMGL